MVEYKGTKLSPYTVNSGMHGEEAPNLRFFASNTTDQAFERNQWTTTQSCSAGDFRPFFFASRPRLSSWIRPLLEIGRLC